MVTPNAGIRVEGAANLRRTLKRAGEDLEDFKAAHAAAAAIAGGRARSDAPRRSGRLGASVRWSGARATATLRAGYASVPYAAPIHWGWPARGIAAQPWMSEAARATEAQWTAVYEAAVEAALRRVKGI